MSIPHALNYDLSFFNQHLVNLWQIFPPLATRLSYSR